MTYIRIKVKHLLAISAAVLLAALAAIYLQGAFLYILGKASEIAGNGERAVVFYDRAADEYPGSAGALAAAERKLELMFRDKDFRYFYKLKINGYSSISGGAYISGGSIDGINRRYEMIAEHAARNDSFARYTIYTGMANYFGGSGEKALSLLESADYIKDYDLEQMRRLNLAAVYMSLGDMEKGYGLIKDGPGGRDGYSALRNALNLYYCFMTGRLELFRSMEGQQDNWYRDTKNLKDPLLEPLLDINNVLNGYAEIARVKDKQAGTGNVFYGRVTDEGKPVAYAVIYLKDADKRGSETSLIDMGDGVGGVAVTDGEGYFRMEGVPNGIYGAGIAIEWTRVQGKALRMYKNYDLKFTGGTGIEKNFSFSGTKDLVSVSDAGNGRLEFTVALPQDAAYYTITMGELREVEGNTVMPFSSFFSGAIRTPDYVLDTEKERLDGMLENMSYSMNGIDPCDLMEPFYHTGDYEYRITFYDSRGDTLFDSGGIYPNRHENAVHVGGNEWSEADRLLLDKKYDEAISLYKAETGDPGKGLHALKVLAKLYNYGWIYNPKTNMLEGGDSDRALEYYGLLAGRIPENNSIKSELARLYIKRKDYARAIEILENIPNDPYTNREIGRIYGYMGSFNRAVGYYERFCGTTGQGADMLLMLYMLQGRRELLAGMAARYTDNGSYYADYAEIIGEYLKMDTSAYDKFFSLIRQDEPESAERLLEGRNDDLALLYRGLLLLQENKTDRAGADEYEKRYADIYGSVEGKTVKQLMKYFGKAGIQSGFGDY